VRQKRNLLWKIPLTSPFCKGGKRDLLSAVGFLPWTLFR
jgi:hypothetical protein